MGIGNKFNAMAAYQAGAPPPGMAPGAPPPNAPYPPPPQQNPQRPLQNPPAQAYPSQQYPPPQSQQYPPPNPSQPYGAPPPPQHSAQYPPPGQPYPPPPQPYGQPAASGPMAGNSQKYRQQIRVKLQDVVRVRQLDPIYPPHRLDALADQVARTVDIEQIAKLWRLPVEIALDLCSMALYDVVIYADDSYSMQGENWDSDLRTIVQKTASVAVLFDSDGISVRFMNGKMDRDSIRTEGDVMALFRDAKPCGLTPIGTSLKSKVLDPYVQYLRTAGQDRTRLKPMMVITVTDGEPQGESRDTLFNVIRDLRRTLTSMGFSGNEVAFQFAQVGDDAKATDFLDSLDNHPEIGRFVDATSNFEREAEQWSRRSGGASVMTPDLYLVKLLCGAIDNEWDSKDETPAPSQGPYPGQQPQYPPQGGYPPQPGYPPQQPYPQQPGYPPQQPPGYSPYPGPSGQQPGYPPQSSYPPAGGYPPQSGYPPQPHYGQSAGYGGR